MGMSFLAATDKGFRQLVAIDLNFSLFSRAWCVAELAAADKMGIQQSLAMHSRESLQDAQDRLRDLRIEAMSAARPEDVEEILSRIPDVSGFNDHLQEMLFGNTGLL